MSVPPSDANIGWAGTHRIVVVSFGDCVDVAAAAAAAAVVAVAIIAAAVCQINDSCSSRLEESVQSFFREADEQFGWSPGPDRKRPLVKVGFHVRLTDASDHLERFNNASRFTGAQLLGMMEEVLQVIKLDARGACGMRTCSC